MHSPPIGNEKRLQESTSLTGLASIFNDFALLVPKLRLGTQRIEAPLRVQPDTFGSCPLHPLLEFLIRPCYCRSKRSFEQQRSQPEPGNEDDFFLTAASCGTG